MEQKQFLTLILAAVCSVSMIMTKGESGIGWFIFGLVIIW
jgi:hypothetical protein